MPTIPRPGETVSLEERVYSGPASRPFDEGVRVITARVLKIRTGPGRRHPTMSLEVQSCSGAMPLPAGRLIIRPVGDG